MTGKQRRHLRALGHHLDAVVQVGKGGIGEGLLGALDAALAEHELIKVRLADAVGAERHALAGALAEAAGAELVQVLGRTILLYRADPKEPRIALPPA